MGMFDSLMLRCPHCDHLNEEQFKDGDCTLSMFTLDDLPKHLLPRFDGRSITCLACTKTFQIKIEYQPTGILVPSGVVL